MWQHIELSVQIHPWNALACCWDVKQPTNKQTSFLSSSFPQAIHAVILWWTLFLNVPQASHHFCPAELQMHYNGSSAYQSVCLFTLSNSLMARGVCPQLSLLLKTYMHSEYEDCCTDKRPRERSHKRMEDMVPRSKDPADRDKISSDAVEAVLAKVRDLPSQLTSFMKVSENRSALRMV